MMTLSAFADEISPDLDEQLSVLRAEGIRSLELRSVWDVNVLDLDAGQMDVVRAALRTAGIGVSAIGSPIGKTPIDAPFDDVVHRFERAITAARFFEASYIRLFSFYPPADPSLDPDISSHRETVLHHLRELTARARAANVTLLHENERDIYGETIDRCVEILAGVDDSRFQAILDPANFIQCGQRPFPDGYRALAPWLRYVHVKDAMPDGEVVAAGEGTADWPSLLRQMKSDGFDGFLSLEPHLASAQQFKGFSGPDLFRYASQALQRLLRAAECEYA